MHSVFSLEDAKANGETGFWQRGGHVPEACECEGELQVMIEGRLRPRYFLLADTTLYYCRSSRDRRSLRYIQLSWKLLSPFMESLPCHDLFGFSVGTEDFYTTSQPQLDKWLSSLFPKCVLLDFDLHLSTVLGKGTFATVYLGKNAEDQWAVKRVQKVGSDSGWQKMVVQEVTALRALSHPHIVRLWRVYEDDMSVCLALDHMKGGDLLTRLQQCQCYSEAEARLLFHRLLEAVAYIHSQGYIHRDIKAENILLARCDENCEFKLADFGLATLAPNSLQEKCGSPGYVAPEILRRGSYGLKADIFSCGVLLYLLLSGQFPFHGNSADEILAKNRECRISFNAQHWSGISRQGVELVLQLTNPNPLQRFSSSQALDHEWFTCTGIPTPFPERIGAKLHRRQPQQRISGELLMRLSRRSSEEASASLEKLSDELTRSCRECLAAVVRVEQCHSPGRVLRG